VLIEDFPIRIRTRDLVVVAESISYTPNPIAPGKEARVTLSIKNNADSLVRDLKVKLDMSSEDLPFAPIGSTSEKSLYQLDAQNQQDFLFDIIAQPDAKGGIYKIPLTIEYTDEIGTEYKKEDIATLKISSTPDILAVIETSEIFEKNKAGEISIRLVNRGLTNIKLLSAELRSNKDFEVLSQEEQYVGNIDTDDFETVEYILDILSKESTVTLPLKITYRDVTNREYQRTKELILKVLNNNQAKKAGYETKGPTGVFIILIIVIGGLAIYFWRVKRKKKKKELR